MTILASLAQILLMRPFTLPRVPWPIHLNPAPLFDPVSHPVCIRTIQTRFSQTVACLTALVVYPGVVLCSVVHAYRDRDPLARPSVGLACAVVAGESAHDVGVVCLGASFVVVVGVEVEM